MCSPRLLDNQLCKNVRQPVTRGKVKRVEGKIQTDVLHPMFQHHLVKDLAPCHSHVGMVQWQGFLLFLHMSGRGAEGTKGRTIGPAIVDYLCINGDFACSSLGRQKSLKGRPALRSSKAPQGHTLDTAPRGMWNDASKHYEVEGNESARFNKARADWKEPTTSSTNSNTNMTQSHRGDIASVMMI